MNWSDEQRVLRDALAKKHDLVDHPKLDAAFQIAWDEGHSAGANEVGYYFDDLVELLDCTGCKFFNSGRSK